eukprot:gene2464-4784_t
MKIPVPYVLATSFPRTSTDSLSHPNNIVSRMKIFIKPYTSKPISFDCESNETIYDLKQKIQDKPGIPKRDQRQTLLANY